jgi:hypothetical protein
MDTRTTKKNEGPAPIKKLTLTRERVRALVPVRSGLRAGSSVFHGDSVRNGTLTQTGMGEYDV